MSTISVTNKRDQISALEKIKNLEETFLDQVSDAAQYEIHLLKSQRQRKEEDFSKKRNEAMNDIHSLDQQIAKESASVSTPHRFKLKQLDDELSDISKEIFGREKEIEALKENNISLEEDNKQKSIDLNAKESHIDKKIESMSNKLLFYEKYLGLKSEVVQDSNLLKLIFTYIHENDIDREFMFSIQVSSDDNSWKVMECAPKIEDIDSLVSELNESDDLKTFLCKMRKSFKRLCVPES